MTMQTSSGDEANIIGERCIAELKQETLNNCYSATQDKIPSRWMRFQQELTWRLAEALDLVLDGFPHDRVDVAVELHCRLVGYNPDWQSLRVDW